MLIYLIVRMLFFFLSFQYRVTDLMFLSKAIKWKFIIIIIIIIIIIVETSIKQ